MRPTTTSIALLTALLLWGPETLAATYHVSTTGSDSSAGSSTAPWKTFKYATSKLSPGDTLIVNAGTYKEQLLIPTKGTASTPVAVKAAAGAKVIIDGVTNTLPATDNTGLIEMTGDYITVDGFEIQYSKWYGATSSGKNNNVKNCTIHHSIYYAVRYSYAENGTISKNTIYQNVQKNSNLGGLGAGCMLIQSSTNISALNNTVYNNYGNGISIVEGKDITATENLVYDNASYNISVINTTNVIVRRNFAYCTGDKKYAESGMNALGINLEGLKSSGGTAPTSVIANNIVVGCEQGIYWSLPTGANGMENMVIANNTVVNSVSEGIYLDAGTAHKNSTIANNIVVQSSTGGLIYFCTASGITFKSNNWVGGKPLAGASSPDDILTDCKLVNPKSFKADGFKLTNGSFCQNSGTTLTDVTVDYFGTKRPFGPAYDIGAHESTTKPPPDTGIPDGLKDMGPSSDAEQEDSTVAVDAPYETWRKEQGAAPDQAQPDSFVGDSMLHDSNWKPPPEPPESSSCNCRTSGAPGGGALLALLLLGLLMLRRRRR